MRPYFTLIIFAFLAWGCGPGPQPDNFNDPGIYSLDSNVFFKIHFQNQTYSTYGIKTIGLPTNSPLLIGSYYGKITSETDNLGISQNKLSIFSMGSHGNQLIMNSGLHLNQCDFYCLALNSGGVAGNYYFSGSPWLKIITEVASSSYQIDTRNAYQFAITSLEESYLSGSFSCYLIASSGLSGIPATGSFKLNRIY